MRVAFLLLALCAVQCRAQQGLRGAIGHLFHDDEVSRRRELHVLNVLWPGCVGKSVTHCEEYIKTDLDQNQQLTNGKPFKIEVLTKRARSDEDYFKVVLVTNEDGNVVGNKGDSIVSYPFDWFPKTGPSINVGPWECTDQATGKPLAFSACCSMIKQNVPMKDNRGNYIGCFEQRVMPDIVEAPDASAETETLVGNRILIVADPNTGKIEKDTVPMFVPS